MQAPEYTFSTGALFTVLFVMLGPLKLIGPFGVGTRNLSEAALRSLAFKATLIATATALLGGFAGRALLAKWDVSIAALMLAAGIVFFLVSLKMVLVPYEHPVHSETAPELKAFDVAFPLMVTPYGIAAVIAVLSNSQDRVRGLSILGLVVLMMVLDLLAMLFVRPILKYLGVPLKLLGAVLGVLLLALSVQIILDALTRAGIV